MNLSDVKAIHIGSDEVIQISMNGTVMWTKPAIVTDLLYMKNDTQSAGTLSVVKQSSFELSYHTLYYSFDTVNWTQYDFTSNPTISVPANKTIYLKGTQAGHPNDGKNFSLHLDVDHIVGGNLCSIIDMANYQSMTTVAQKAVVALFENDTYLTDASDLNIGNVTSLENEAFSNLFNGCTSLTTPPDFSTLTTLNGYALHRCFQGCTSLTKGVYLGNVTVSNGNGQGIDYMYTNCSSITEVWYPSCLNMSGNRGWMSGTSATGTMYFTSQTYADDCPVSQNGCPSGWVKSYPVPPAPTPDCLCFTNQTSTAGTITISGSGRGFSASIAYSSDNGDTWSGESVSDNTITLPANGKVYIKGDWSTANDTYQYRYSCDVDYALSGNLLSILDSTNYASETYIPSFAFISTFIGDTHLVDITGLNLGVATTVGSEAMIGTFEGTSITAGMDLRQIDTIDYYSQRVFEGFYYNCSNLTTAYAPTDTVWGSGGGMGPNYYGWLSGVAASGTIYCSSQAVANAIPTGSVDGCPTGWTVSVIS